MLVRIAKTPFNPAFSCTFAHVSMNHCTAFPIFPTKYKEVVVVVGGADFCLVLYVVNLILVDINQVTAELLLSFRNQLLWRDEVKIQYFGHIHK